MMFVSIVFKSESLSRFALLADDGVEVVLRCVLLVFVLDGVVYCVLCERLDHRMIYHVEPLCVEAVVYLLLIASQGCQGCRKDAQDVRKGRVGSECPDDFEVMKFGDDTLILKKSMI